MKKRFAMIAAALTGAMMISFSAVPASASSNQIDEQYVTEENGQTVVYLTTYVEPNGFSNEQTVSWSDANGTKYVHVYKVRQQEPALISSSATWYDGAGNKYVLDDTTQTVTVFDAEGNVLAVKPA